MTGPSVPAASGLVLAGGRSSRFGRNKLAEPLGGRPLLAHAVTAIGLVVREVIVLLPPVGDPPALPRTVGDGRIPVRLARDPEPFGGPLVAVLAGLERAREPFALLAGGDMPGLAGPVLAALLRALEASEDVEAAVLEFRGRRQQLPAAFRVGAATIAARRLLGEGERSLHAFLRALRTRELREGEWRALDPAAATLRDIDLPDDLAT
ncbi:MAG TPA: molybdenum cofactor guanylyltransferase [Candidatus Limnocylindrales bacterium]|jgi:molybdopterin-guanine dinucleotide biosynthesis protein A|nr:molybdenum cofactor guanylyltransferase [Candidatus Limnocylindrales bacterium]